MTGEVIPFKEPRRRVSSISQLPLQVLKHVNAELMSAQKTQAEILHSTNAMLAEMKGIKRAPITRSSLSRHARFIAKSNLLSDTVMAAAHAYVGHLDGIENAAEIARTLGMVIMGMIHQSMSTLQKKGSFEPKEVRDLAQAFASAQKGMSSSVDTEISAVTHLKSKISEALDANDNLSPEQRDGIMRLFGGIV
ncbi:MAG: phage protein Gp27 family protein [Pseudomonadota bacterium]